MDDAERESRVSFLKTFLADRDVPCPMCAYNLRALQTAKCPECGSEVEVTVGLTEPRMAAFIAGVVGLAIGLGFHGLLMGWIGWLWLKRPRSGPPSSVWAPLVIGVVVTGVAMVVWLRARRRIRQEPSRHRLLLVLGCYGLSLGSAAWFFAVAR